MPSPHEHGRPVVLCYTIKGLCIVPYLRLHSAVESESMNRGHARKLALRAICLCKRKQAATTGPASKHHVLSNIVFQVGSDAWPAWRLSAAASCRDSVAPISSAERRDASHWPPRSPMRPLPRPTAPRPTLPSPSRPWRAVPEGGSHAAT